MANAEQPMKRYLTEAVRSILAGEPLGRVARRRCLVLSGVLCIATAITITPAIAVDKNSIKHYEYKAFAALIINDSKQMKCLDKLWTKESNWRPTAKNKKSSAFGIPQLLKMTETNPYRQIVLGIKYLDHRYKGDVCLALRTHNTKGHY
jgi:hypothetical protein